MPNHAYMRSVRRERQTVNELRALGFICARSAGSKSPVDVWAYHPGRKEVRLIQIKTQKGGRGLEEFNEEDPTFNCTVFRLRRIYS